MYIALLAHLSLLIQIGQLIGWLHLKGMSVFYISAVFLGTSRTRFIGTVLPLPFVFLHTLFVRVQ